MFRRKPRYLIDQNGELRHIHYRQGSFFPISALAASRQRNLSAVEINGKWVLVEVDGNEQKKAVELEHAVRRRQGLVVKAASPRPSPSPPGTARSATTGSARPRTTLTSTLGGRHVRRRAAPDEGAVAAAAGPDLPALAFMPPASRWPGSNSWCWKSCTGWASLHERRPRPIAAHGAAQAGQLTLECNVRGPDGCGPADGRQRTGRAPRSAGRRAEAAPPESVLIPCGTPTAASISAMAPTAPKALPRPPPPSSNTSATVIC